MVLVPQKQGLLPVLVIDLTDQTDLDEHDIKGHLRGLVVSDSGYHAMGQGFKPQ